MSGVSPIHRQVHGRSCVSIVKCSATRARAARPSVARSAADPPATVRAPRQARRIPRRHEPADLVGRRFPACRPRAWRPPARRRHRLENRQRDAFADRAVHVHIQARQPAARVVAMPEKVYRVFQSRACVSRFAAGALRTVTDDHDRTGRPRPTAATSPRRASEDVSPDRDARRCRRPARRQATPDRRRRSAAARLAGSGPSSMPLWTTSIRRSGKSPSATICRLRSWDTDAMRLARMRDDGVQQAALARRRRVGEPSVLREHDRGGPAAQAAPARRTQTASTGDSGGRRRRASRATAADACASDGWNPGWRPSEVTGVPRGSSASPQAPACIEATHGLPRLARQSFDQFEHEPFGAAWVEREDDLEDGGNHPFEPRANSRTQPLFNLRGLRLARTGLPANQLALQSMRAPRRRSAPAGDQEVSAAHPPFPRACIAGHDPSAWRGV